MKHIHIILKMFENLLKTLMSGLIQVVHKKTAGSHVALGGNISASIRVTDLVKVLKDAASLLVYTRKKFFSLGDAGFLSDVISGGLFGHLGQLHLALGANR